MEIDLTDPEAQTAFGTRLAACLTPPFVLYLEGDLGTGKTTLTRGLLRGLGHEGAVRSPTYTLIEPYELPIGRLHHLDLYRLGASEELEYLGLRDLMEEGAIWVVEWPDRGMGMLPSPDLRIRIDHLTEGRRLSLVAESGAGESLLTRLP
ncbi:tRNA (adenosine(37)-N6)-threonylcarbamoyltransferase complex ATPase subunit type 1 TsaE [Imhoffiella purpurea]|uniref:tRNA threonylcarbamoyladenosine biosynthesis protein TsaE n=1 Tax=Imhoffiella purpurea TaxID=1249627 RepID=W9VK61_9GAMM|nr:tRNA (adenosine(37)-N6)-threonylcarbamoyltransferase complex ATPase subunit type 1 TsaE [Imhoffiella purpurea]EXJ16472.1 ATPase YjeE [Imhoffiella purpurea]